MYFCNGGCVVVVVVDDPEVLEAIEVNRQYKLTGIVASGWVAKYDDETKSKQLYRIPKDIHPKTERKRVWNNRLCRMVEMEVGVDDFSF